MSDIKIKITTKDQQLISFNRNLINIKNELLDYNLLDYIEFKDYVNFNIDYNKETFDNATFLYKCCYYLNLFCINNLNEFININKIQFNCNNNNLTITKLNNLGNYKNCKYQIVYQCDNKLSPCELNTNFTSIILFDHVINITYQYNNKDENIQVYNSFGDYIYNLITN